MTDTPEPGAASVALPMREQVARIVYEAMWQAANYPGKPDPEDEKWQVRGNSPAQDGARQFADRILGLTPPTSTGAEVERETIRADIINTPETADFMAAVPLEAAHQRERWGSDHDAGKSPFDWFWLIGYLAQKAADAAIHGDAKKAMHHTISTAAALANWHAALSGKNDAMRPGIGPGNGGEKPGSAYRLAAALAPITAEPARGDAGNGYIEAFYDLARLLGVGARPTSPREIWENEMRPVIVQLLAHQSCAEVEQKARELLAAEYKRDGASWNFVQEIRRGNINRVGLGVPFRALCAALAPIAPKPNAGQAAEGVGS